MTARERGGGSAVVARVDFGACVLMPDDGPVLEATVRGRVMGPTKSLGSTVVVGDRVRYELERGRAAILESLPRRNTFSRRAGGRRLAEQVVAANLDQVVLVASTDAPEFRPGFADRVLSQAEHAGIPARLVLNKVDRVERGLVAPLLADYSRAGYAAHAVSALTGEGVEELRHACLARRSLFVGQSGVGKSTLLNTMVPGLDLLIGRVNPKTGKGRHTTTAAWLVRPVPEFELIDTPGMRTFGLWGIGARELEQSYPEFRRFLGLCRFADCRHDREPGCALAEALVRGDVPPRRFESFLKLRAELEEEGGRE